MDPEARNLPSGEKARQRTADLWLVINLTQFPVTQSHSLKLLSEDPVPT